MDSLVSIPLAYVLLLSPDAFESIARERIVGMNFRFETNLPLPWSIFYTTKKCQVTGIYPDFRVAPEQMTVESLRLFSVKDKFSKVAKVAFPKNVWERIYKFYERTP